MKYLIYSIIIVLIIGWILGFLVFQILGGLIHLLLVLAVLLIVYNWFTERKKNI
ncbi:lmo0937 family membrane protein [Zobellia laminariae]|uniref:lmo0937 family membrane protein n=1 Tax=Zobellia laminariae TaxID=248906 RepID=UPI0012D92682|nr:lmo0937 family membrane protein [Zobellia laminariae]MUH41266.1 lmo0937 family membrane protein [Zobellia laminariae]WKX76684.1 lmo0937 family membrane protein [Zobellia laminariae]